MIRLVTDSTAYVPAEFVRAYDIQVVPLKVQWGQETYAEIAGLDNRQLFLRLATMPGFPATSQPAAGEFQRAYRQILSRDASSEILVVTVSSKLSGTYQAAVSAARALPQARITVFDSLSAAMGAGLMVITAGEMAGRRGDLAQILDRLHQMRRDTSIFLMVDNLDYLRRGGRIGAASAFLGTLLQTKPILTITAGRLEAVERVRTHQKALNRLWQLLAQRLDRPDLPVQAGVMHVAAPAAMESLAGLLREHFNITRLFTAELGPVIGVHLGPGAVGAGICPEIG
ncbi:MAG: DegV family protein [Chloroflexota bacterium]